MRKIWCYAWAYVFVLLGLLDRLGDWLEDQVDHNDYLAGAVGALALLAIPYLIGVIDIVIWG
jgi:hypothetical protein